MKDKISDIVASITYNQLYDLMFKQFMSFAEYTNDSNGLVETWKYADYALYVLNCKFNELKKERGWEFPK